MQLACMAECEHAHGRLILEACCCPLHIPPDLLPCTVSATGCTSPWTLQEGPPAQQQLALLQHLAGSEQGEPWAQLHRLGSAAGAAGSKGTQEEASWHQACQALMSCIDYVELFLPNALLMTLDLQVGG